MLELIKQLKVVSNNGVANKIWDVEIRYEIGKRRGSAGVVEAKMSEGMNETEGKRTHDCD